MNSVKSRKVVGLRQGVALAAVMAGWTCLPHSALAQDASGDQPASSSNVSSDKTAPSDKDIVVTGTLIRGVEVTGSQAMTVSAQDISIQAPTTTNELLASLPQITNTFNGRPFEDPRSVGQISINRPNLRNLPGVNASSGSVTLVLVDGHRITPVGTNASAVDVDIIPTSILERVDIVTDGGSSLYGADAVSGVINFITKKKFDGIRIDADYGFGTTLTSYNEWNASITAGTSWKTGNAYISVGHNYNSNVLNSDASWAKSVNFTAPGVYTNSGTQCINPVGTTDTYSYVNIPGLFSGWTDNAAVPGNGKKAIGTPCDTFGASSYTPKNERSNVFGSVTQQVADNIEFHMTAYWTKHDTTVARYPTGYTSAAAPAPVGAPGTPGAPASSPTSISAGVGYSYAPNAAYVHKNQTQRFETWGFTPEIKIDLGGDWQDRTTIHYGQSYNHYFSPGVNAALTNSDIAAGRLNPLNVAAASASVVNAELDWQDSTDTNQQLFDMRTVADGPLFALPGGDARLAVGLEFQENSAQLQLTSGPAGSSLGHFKGSRNAKSAFGELSLPITSFLNVSGSLRYDSYSDFGGTTNPTIGAKIKPVSWLSIFGHWGKSFNAPTVIDSFAISTGAFFPTFGNALLLNGSAPDLKPQTAKTWAVGFEANPVSSLRFGMEYYKIDFRNILGQVDPTTQNCTTNPGQIICSPSPQVAQDYVNQTLNAGSLQAAIDAAGGTVGQIVDRRTTNISSAVLRGIDFHLYYTLPTDSAGRFDFGLNGNKQLEFSLATAGVSGSTDQLLNNPDFTASAFVGWGMGGFSSRVTVNYTGSSRAFDFTNTAVKVTPFVVTNLFLGYDFKDSGSVLNGLSLRLNVDNLFEREPQFLERNASANQITYTSYTLGRVIKLGFTKQF